MCYIIKGIECYTICKRMSIELGDYFNKFLICIFLRVKELMCRQERRVESLGVCNCQKTSQENRSKERITLFSFANPQVGLQTGHIQQQSSARTGGEAAHTGIELRTIICVQFLNNAFSPRGCTLCIMDRIDNGVANVRSRNQPEWGNRVLGMHQLLSAF